MSRRPSLHYGAVIRSPRDKVAHDRELDEQRRAQLERNRAARAEWRAARAVRAGGIVCRVCKTPISAAESVARGIGPVCWAHREKGTP